ncbi:MAG: T9SS type A sorting domain-containing protein [Rhodothermaceae bacterium]|nr:T9SS type A sorting domain-containing protein [Rhodothermaceae bacterium]MYK64154.1 T9SS type A sorting domain-containing protein [Rhodothermaceae bacterium]
MTYTLDPSPPAGLSFDATTRILSGTPTTPMEITPYTYTAVDTYSRTIHLEFEISVAGFESEVATQFLTVGVPFTPIQLPEAIGGQPPMTYTLDPSPPAGLSFDATTRILSGTPTTPMDRTTYTYTALDTDSRPIYLDFEISVAGAVQFQSTVTDYSFPRATPISPIILPAATGGTAPVIYNLHPKLPSDLSFADSTLTITGTPFFVTDNTQYTYFAIDVNGSADTLQFSLMIYSPVSIQTETLPTTFALKSNYPNPFKRSTRIMFDLPSKAKISVEVLDVAGRLMRRIPAQTIPAGWSQGVDFNGADLPSGMYVYRVQIVSTEGVQDTHTGRFIVVR